MTRLLTYLRIALAMLMVAIMIPIVYIGKKLTDPPKEGDDYGH